MDYGSRESSSGYSSMPPRRSEIQRTGSYRSMSAEIEQVVTKLLRTTKSLLEALNLWSQSRMSTSDIFELHRTLENQFYMVSQSFEEAHVKTSDLSWIPHQLRQSVVECMDQQPSISTLDQYLPRIRDVIVHLLHGLKGKQQQLRELDMQATQMPSPTPPPLTQRDSFCSQDHYSRSSVSLTHSDSTGSNKSGRTYYSQQDRTSPTPIPGTPDRMVHPDYDPYTSGMPRPSVSSDARKFYSQGSTPSSPPQQQQPRKPYYTSASSSPSQQPFPSRSVSRTSTSSRQGSSTVAASSPPPPPPPPPPAPPAQTSASTNYLQPPGKSNSNDFDESDPHTASALAALKRQENLARRSSVRRASMYRGNTSADYASKRYLSNAPPVPSLQHNSTMERLDENQPATGNDTAPVTSTPSSTGNTSADNGSDTTTTTTTSPSSSENASPSSLTLYLQMDQQTKKVSYSGEITLPALSMLFIERFGYSAGQQDFPTIYIRDPSLPNVSYELQDMDDVTDKSILSFTLQDQKQEKSKEWMEPMLKEWNETRRTMLEHMERLEQKMADRSSETETLVQQVVRKTLASTTPQPSTQVATTESETKDDDDKSNTPQTDTTQSTEKDPAPSDTTTEKPEPAVDLEIQRQQQDEIDKLQRQLMVLRQAQTEQQDEHNKVVKELQDENQKLKAMVDKNSGDEGGDDDDMTPLAKATPSQARQYIEQGKEELLTSSDKITARLEDLQDAIDHLKLDVTQRKCRPSETQMEHCREERKALGDEIEAFGVYITKVKPIWKKTWEQELQTIVKEQQTLKEQEGLLLDMNDDLAALQEVFENLEKICAFQEKARTRHVREFHVAPPEDGFEGMTSVLKQVATIDVDHDRRLKALDMADRMRQRELANRIDDFEKELSTFVDNKKLKKTGGAMEIDRLRQEKDEAMRQQLYKEKQQQQQQSKDGDGDSEEKKDAELVVNKDEDGMDAEPEPEPATDDDGVKST